MTTHKIQHAFCTFVSMRNFKIVLACAFLLYIQLTSCKTEANRNDAHTENFSNSPNRVEVTWYKTVIFSSTDSAAIQQLASVISKAEKDSIKKHLEAIRARNKADREDAVPIERPVLVLQSEDPIRINLYHDKRLIEEIVFLYHQAPVAIKKILESKGVNIKGAKFNEKIFESNPSDLWIEKSSIQIPKKSEMKFSRSVSDSTKESIRKVLAQRTPSIRHLRNKHLKKFGKPFHEEAIPTELAISITFASNSTSSTISQVKAEFPETFKAASEEHKAKLSQYLKEVETTIFYWKFAINNLKEDLTVEFPLYTNSHNGPSYSQTFKKDSLK